MTYQHVLNVHYISAGMQGISSELEVQCCVASAATWVCPSSALRCARIYPIKPVYQHCTQTHVPHLACHPHLRPFFGSRICAVCTALLQVVVRRLPPGLTEDAFKATIDKLLPPGTYNWFSYFQGKVRW